MRIKRCQQTSYSLPNSRLALYFANMQRDLKLFGFLLALLCLYRLAFMGLMSGYMEADAGISDILQANWSGLRLSLKSAGAFTAFSFVLVTLPGIFHPRLSLQKLRVFIGTLAAFILSVLFEARFPYYDEFHMTYGMQVMQGAHDDRAAIFMTMVQEYGLLWRMGIVLVLTALCCLALRQLLLRRGTVPLPRAAHARPVLTSLGLLAFFVLFFLFSRFGGGVNYATGINWENAAVTKDSFLNECVLDDVQAMYRAIQFEENMKAGDIYGVEKGRIREMAARAAVLNGHAGTAGDDLAAYLTRQAPGAKIEKPRHIFLVIGESWAQWPMLEKYEKLHVADGIKSLMDSPQGCYTQAFLPTGEFTAIALTGIITGLSDVNIRANYQPRSFEAPYPTAFAPQFKALGYQADFWYGGTPDWANLRRLALAQGFDHFYGYPDFGAPRTNPWGTSDRYLFEALEKTLVAEGGTPTVHVIMTTSNHPPYNIDLEAEGFDLEAAKAAVRELIPDAEDPDTLAMELGHYWYMDKLVADFAKETLAKYPDSLFVITGDHAVRTNPGPQPTMFEFQSVPFVLYGQGISKEILPQDAVGCHTGIAPTLINLIAPKGYEYQAIAPAIGEAPVAFSSNYWLTSRLMGKINAEPIENLPGRTAGDAGQAKQELDTYLPMMRTISWWLLEHGRELK